MPKSERVIVKDRVDENVCDLSLSELTEVPVKQIASFKRVTQLDLSSNRLLTLGKNFIILTRLTKLDLSKNQIKYLPEDFGLLCNLRHLDLYDNKLEHLPLGFGDLTNLRYLDLKGNPLTPALGKIVGLCLTTKECHDAARNTVRFLKDMQSEAEKAKAEYQQSINSLTESESADMANAKNEQKKENIGDNAKEKIKKSNKKSKAKAKKSNAKAETTTIAKKQNNTIEDVAKTDNVKVKKGSNSAKKAQNAKMKCNSKAALMSILSFCFLLFLNVAGIYLMLYHNPDIADNMVKSIPPEYRDWILSKTEFFRLRVTDWISQFQTPPDEH